MVPLIAGHNKEKKAKLTDLESEVISLEHMVLTSDESADLHRVRVEQKEHRDTAEDAAKARAVAMQHRIYEAVDKAGKLLACLDKKETADRWVPIINQVDGKAADRVESV